MNFKGFVVLIYWLL